VKFLSVLTLIAIMSTGLVLMAEKMDSSTHTLVIEKLERVLSLTDSENPSRSAIMQRLADLHAERARLAAMEEIEQKCDACRGSKKDRLRALELYETLYSKGNYDLKSRIALQMIQLYDLSGQNKKSLDLFDSIIKSKKGNFHSELVGHSYASLGDAAFKKAKYKKALELYKNALSIKNTPRRGYIMSRVGWCYLHQKNYQEAQRSLVAVLSNEDLLTRDGKDDLPFREDLSRDLATFYSRGDVGLQEIKSLSDLSPEGSRKENLNYMAQELDRLGKKQSALLVLQAVGEEQKNPKDKIEGYIRLAHVNYDMGKKPGVVVEIVKAIEIWKNHGCTPDEECNLLQKKMRKLLTGWAKSEEHEPSTPLVKAYSAYTAFFKDIDMALWAAQTAKQLQLWQQSISLYKSAALITDDQAKIEACLLGEIEAAELSKDVKFRESAYAHYLNILPDGQKSTEVRYQQVQLLYEQNKYADAANGFRAIAKNKDSKSIELREKAADLALDSLVLAKREDLIEHWANEFAEVLPKRKLEFHKISRTAVLNNVAVAMNEPATIRRYEDQLVKLNTVKLDGANSEEKISYFKNRLILAEKTNNLDEVNYAADGLLSVQQLSESDREYALTRKVWAAEITLNFALAYKLSLKLKFAELSQEERTLKLALLAELANQDAEDYYQKYLKITKDENQAQKVMARLVRSSRNGEVVLKKYQKRLKQNKELYARLVLEIFAKNQDFNFAEQFLNTSKLRDTAAGQVISRFLFLNKFEKDTNHVTRHKINAKSDSQLKKSLQDRLSLLSNLEQSAQKGIKTGDWVIQVITLHAVATEYRRLADDIHSLPLPGGLKGKQEKEYKTLISQQAKPYLNKAEAVEHKLGDLWKKSELSTLVADELKITRGDLKNLLIEELKLISRVAPSREQRVVKNIIDESQERPSQRALDSARQDVKENPFDKESVEKLKNLEERIGHETLVAYLEARLAQLQKGKRL